MQTLTKDQALIEFRRIVADELPKVKVKLVGKHWVKASPADAALSKKLSTQLAKLLYIAKGI